MSRVRGAASAQPTPCFSSYFAILCVYRSMLSVYTRPRKAQSVRPMIGYEMPPQPRAHAMSRARVALLWQSLPLLFFLFWLCSCYSPCTEGCPWSGGGGVRHAPRMPGFSSYFALLHDEAYGPLQGGICWDATTRRRFGLLGMLLQAISAEVSETYRWRHGGAWPKA